MTSSGTTLARVFEIVVVIALMALGGCADRNHHGQPDTISQPAVNSAIAKVEEATKNAASKIEPAVQEAEKKAAPVVKNLANAAVTTSKVKAALLANRALRERVINVDTKNKSVVLRGAVQNAQQKALAGQIAAQSAPGYKVVNQLELPKAMHNKPSAR